VIEPTDLDALAEQLGTERLDGLYGARGFGSSTYVRDPDGNMIELKAYAS
jgi:catechol 2,3-dioxygenase-like lactoylglutathione lyase family enzyme